MRSQTGARPGVSRPGAVPSPARVLLLSRPLRVGAYQRKAELIAEDPRFELTVAVPERWREGGMERPLERKHVAGYELVALPVMLPGRFHVHAFRGLSALIERVKPHLIHIDEEAYNLAAYQALRAARGSGAKALFFTWQNLRRNYPPPFGSFEKAMYRNADGAIAGSRSAEDVLRMKGFAGPLWVVPQFGVDAERFFPPTVPRQSDVGRLRIGYAGRLVPEKGLDVLLEAAAIVARESRSATGARLSDDPGASVITLGVQRPAVTVELIGDGPERTRLEARAAELGLQENVRFTSRLNSTEMPAFYQRIDALVLASRTTRSWKEQFGRVLIEAMACGAVCVGSDSGEIPQVIGNAGLTFREDDPEALAASLMELAANPAERVRLSEAGRARVVEHFTMQRIADATARVWFEVLGGSSNSG